MLGRKEIKTNVDIKYCDNFHNDLFLASPFLVIFAVFVLIFLLTYILAIIIKNCLFKNLDN
jgi:hypothetical protein